VKTLAAAWLCLVVLACASASRQTMATAPQANTAGATPMPAGDPRAQIEELSNRIAAERQQMSLAPPTEPMAAPTAPLGVSHIQDASCHPASTATCSDTCTLSDSICDNAGKICKLADSLPGDDWAAGKCNTAKQTCSGAHKRCCECS